MISDLPKARTKALPDIRRVQNIHCGGPWQEAKAKQAERPQSRVTSLVTNARKRPQANTRP